MSEYEYSDLLGYEDQGQQSSGGPLRKMLEEALAANKKLTERLEAKDRSDSAEAVLKEKGLDPAVQAMIPADADPKEWVEKYGKFFAATKTVETPPSGEDEQDGEEGKEQKPEPTDEEAQALAQERLAMETILGPDTGIPSKSSMDMIAKLKSFETQDELLAFINSQKGDSDRPASLM